VSDVGKWGRFSGAMAQTWRRSLDRARHSRDKIVANGCDAESLLIHARATALSGDFKTAERLFGDAAAMAPTLADAIEGQAELLDLAGQSDLAVAKYGMARKLRGEVRAGAPDRPFALRRRGRFGAQILAYSSVLESVKRRALPFVARGNAYLADGKPRQALADYQQALRLKPDMPEVIALKGEALSMMKRYREALEAFNTALAVRPKDAEALSGRAVVRMALGRIDEANGDWRRQLELVAPERPAARACVALRMAEYAIALPELERAVAKQPNDPYWRLYRLAALRRLGTPVESADSISSDVWPGPLLAFHAGRLTKAEVLKRADTTERRAEALFQLGVAAWPVDRVAALRWWNEIIDRAVPAMIEYAAARNELARRGS
jgi:Flp pilus assembly protein TadD